MLKSIKTGVRIRVLYYLKKGWIISNAIKNRISKYGLIENQDYVLIDKVIKNQTGRPIIEYALTIDAAKELSMVEGNTKGKQARQYFIETEKKYQQYVIEISKVRNLTLKALGKSHRFLRLHNFNSFVVII